MIVKRVVAVEDDVVQTLPPCSDAEVRVPEGHIWVEGDESFRTLDSNTFGPVRPSFLSRELTHNDGLGTPRLGGGKIELYPMASSPRWPAQASRTAIIENRCAEGLSMARCNGSFRTRVQTGVARHNS